MPLKSKLIILTAVLASLLEIIDTSIVNVAIPTMMGNLGATLENISWVITGYIIANAIVLPLAAWLGLHLGRKNYFTGCILLFTATSVACGLAPNLLTLTIFRILQGLAGGALLPTSQTLIYEQFPKEKAGIGAAIFGMSVMIGPTIGPTLGGYLTDHFGWRMIFNINLPLGLFAAGLAWANIDDHVDSLAAKASRATQKIDLLGLILLVIGVGCIQYVLERGEADDWLNSNTIIFCSVVSIICLPLFVWWELRVANPIVKVSLFRLPLVRSGTLMMLVLGFFLYGLVFIIPVFVDRVLHYDATQTGMLFIPGALLTMFMMPFVGRLISKVDPRLLIFIGFLLVELCLLSLTQYTSQTDETQIFWSMLIRGGAMAFLFVPINTTVLSNFRGQDLGQVAGLMNLLRQIGGSVGIAMIATMLQRAGQQNYLDLSSKVSLLNQATQISLRGAQFAMNNKLSDAVGSGNTYEAALKAIYFRIQNQAFVMSFTQIMWIIFIVALFVTIPLLSLEKPKTGTRSIDVH